MPKPKPRRVWPAVIAAVAVNAAAVVALTTTGAARADLAADHTSVSWDTPDPPAAPDPTGTSDQDAQVLTPAAAFTTTLGAQALPDTLPGVTYSSPPLTPACLTWPDGAHHTTFTPAALDGGAATVQVLTTPTGAGTATVAGWAEHLRSGCDNARPAHRRAAPSDAPAQMTLALSPARNQVLTQVIWSRGDTVAVLTYSPTDPTNHVVVDEALRDLVRAVDTAVQQTLSPVCLDMAPTVADARRNPAHPQYTPHTRAASTRIAAPPRVATPPRPEPVDALPVPQARPFPDLAPILIPGPADPGTTTPPGGSDPDTQRQTGRRPTTPEPQHGPAPMLVDPAEFTTPPAHTDPGPAPTRPTRPDTSLAYQVPIADPDGPGCGWAFTGADGPPDDPDALARAAQHADRAARLQAAAITAQAWLAQLRWAQDWAAWAEADAQHAPVRAYLQAREAAVQAHQEAVEAYQQSLAAWQEHLRTTRPTTPEQPDVDPGTDPEDPGDPGDPGVDPADPVTPPQDPEDPGTDPEPQQPTPGPTPPGTTPGGTL